MSKRSKQHAIAKATQTNNATNVVTLSHAQTNDNATNATSTFNACNATTQTTIIERHDTSKIRHNKNERMTREQIDNEIDKLLYELHTLQNDENAKHKNEQKRVRRALRSFDYYISHTNVVEHETRVKNAIAKYATQS